MQPTKKRKHKTRSIMITKPKPRPKNKFGIDHFKKRTFLFLSFFQKPSRLYFYTDEHLSSHIKCAS
jgi:hypothetical protein